VFRLGYFSKEALSSIRRGGVMSFVATSTIAISLFILGVFLLIFLNLHNLLQMLDAKMDIVAYVKPNVPDSKLDIMYMLMHRIEGIKKVEFVSKEAAWQEFKEGHYNLNLDQYLDSNPLPDSYKIQVSNLSLINSVAKKVANFPEIEDVRYSGALAKKVEKFITIISFGGLVIVGLLGLSTLMIVVNTIRLTVIAREDEITIMQLVGATKGFIKTPFILEGIFLGVLGSVVALAGLKTGYNLAIMNLERVLPFLPINLKTGEVNVVYSVVAGTGIFLGWLGGYVSVSKSLKAD
jgi:cell division transport system permease protein